MHVRCTPHKELEARWALWACYCWPNQARARVEVRYPKGAAPPRSNPTCSAERERGVPAVGLSRLAIVPSEELRPVLILRRTYRSSDGPQLNSFALAQTSLAEVLTAPSASPLAIR